MKKVTVYIPTYNRISLLKRAVDSVTNQTYRNIELIIVDDGSNDGTQNYLREISEADKRIKFILNKKNKGACASRNLAIKNATGIYITGLDDDDYFEIWRIEHLVKNFSGKFSFICTAQLLANDNFGCLNRDVEFNHIDLYMDNLAGNQFFTYTERVVEVGGFDSDLTSSQDLDVMVRLCQRYGKAKRLWEPSYNICTNHGLSRISTSKKKVYGLKCFYGKHKKHIGLRAKVYWFFLINYWSENLIGKTVAIPALILLNPKKFISKAKKKMIVFYRANF